MRSMDRTGGEPVTHLGLFVGAKDIEIRIKPIDIGEPWQRSKARALLLVALSALRKGRGDRSPFGARDGAVGKELSFDVLQRLAGFDSERRGQLLDGLRQ